MGNITIGNKYRHRWQTISNYSLLHVMAVAVHDNNNKGYVIVVIMLFIRTITVMMYLQTFFLSFHGI